MWSRHVWRSGSVQRPAHAGAAAVMSTSAIRTNFCMSPPRSKGIDGRALADRWRQGVLLEYARTSATSSQMSVIHPRLFLMVHVAARLLRTAHEACAKWPAGVITRAAIWHFHSTALD